jgi:hypothetical protein
MPKVATHVVTELGDESLFCTPNDPEDCQSSYRVAIYSGPFSTVPRSVVRNPGFNLPVAVTHGSLSSSCSTVSELPINE